MNLISDTYTNRTFRPMLFAVGVVVLIVALLLVSFDATWKPIIYQFLQRHSSMNFVIGFVPYFGNLAVFLGLFLVYRSKQRPSVATKDDIRRDGH